MILIGNGRVLTQSAANPLIENGCVAVEDNLIRAVGDTAGLKRQYPQAMFVDAGGKVIMPGLINTHMHIYSAFARGMVLDQPRPNKSFSEILENLWWRMDKILSLEDVRYSAYATYLECVKSGVTTVFDHHASQGAVAGSLDVIMDVAKELGVRASLCYEVSDRDGEAVCDAAIKENADFIARAAKDDSDMVKGMFGLHAAFTLSDRTLEKCVAAMGGGKAGFHVHTAEGFADLQDSLARYGKRVVERLFDAGVLGEKSIAVHCIHINGREMDILRETGTMVVHNPESNMGNAVGCAAVLPMLERGLLVGLGTDGYTADMLESMKVAAILHKHNLCDPSVAWAEVPQMLFANNAAIAGRFFEKPLGVLEAGAYADIIVVDYDPHTPMTGGNQSSHILFGMTGRSVTDTMINGRFVMRDRKIQPVDDKEILARSRELSADFWRRIQITM